MTKVTLILIPVLSGVVLGAYPDPEGTLTLRDIYNLAKAIPESKVDVDTLIILKDEAEAKEYQFRNG